MIDREENVLRFFVFTCSFKVSHSCLDSSQTRRVLHCKTVSKLLSVAHPSSTKNFARRAWLFHIVKNKTGRIKRYAWKEGYMKGKG